MAAGGVAPVARNQPAPVPAVGEMLLFRCCWDDVGGGRLRDVGAAFAPGAALFAYHNTAPWSSIVVVDNGEDNDRNLANRGADVIAAITAWNGPRLRCVGFFCHGSPNWLQLGFRNETVNQLADAIAAKATNDVTVPLFACLTGAAPEEWRYQKWREACRVAAAARQPDPPRPADSEPPALAGQGSFAFKLRDRLIQQGRVQARVDAHVSAGHSTHNPDLRRFETPAGSAGFRLTTTADAELAASRRRALGRALREPDGTGSLLLFRFPFQNVDTIGQELDRVAALPLRRRRRA